MKVRFLSIVALVSFLFVPFAPFAASAAADTGVHILYITSPIKAGNTASLLAQTAPATQCSVTVGYLSGEGTTQGLDPKMTSVYGQAVWFWTVDTGTPPGDWPVTVNCGDMSKTVVLTVD